MRVYTPPPAPYRESNPYPELPLTPAFDRLASALSDRYSPERELGAGGMATVYLARNLRTRMSPTLIAVLMALSACAAPAPQALPLPEDVTASDGSWVHSSAHRVRMVPTAPGVELEVLDWGGSGLPLVFVPGLNMNAHTFDEFSPRFTERHRVIAVTRRGHGASSWPESGYEPETLARDLEVVLDSLGLRGPVVLAGHSAGGLEITRIAADQPQRVAGLIYIEAAYDNRTLMNVFAACTLDASFMEAFNRMMPDLFRHTQIDSAGTPFASPKVVSRMMPAMAASLDYAAVEAPALAIYHVPERAEGILLGTRELTRECRDAVQRYLYGGIAQFVEEMERGTVVSLHDTQHNVHLATPDALEAIINRWLVSEGLVR